MYLLHQQSGSAGASLKTHSPTNSERGQRKVTRDSYFVHGCACGCRCSQDCVVVIIKVAVVFRVVFCESYVLILDVMEFVEFRTSETGHGISNM